MISEKISSLISSELEDALNSCTNLPSLPSVALKVIAASKNPDIGIREVSEIIATDPALAAKLLKIANSSMYSQRRAVNNLREALTLLGFNAALTIALSFSLYKSINSSTGHTLSSENYWKRSILSAVIARLLGSKIGVSKLEELFLAGLLQDIGILILECIKKPLYSKEDKKGLKHSQRIEAEMEHLGVEHSVVGAWLLDSWKLPERIVNAVLHSHSINESITEENDEDNNFQYCLNFSGVIADIWLEEKSNELLASTMNAAQIFLGLDKNEFNKLIMDINNELPEISNLFDMNLINEKERDRVLDEARELLLERSIQFIKQSEDDRNYIKDITDKIEIIEEASRLDHLTNIYNRQYIDELLEVEYEVANTNRWPLSLAYIDIDNFKLINDTYGHLVGDEILKVISDYFSKNIRETDILARYGGDEFLLVLPGSTSSITKSVLERLLRMFEDEVTLDVKGLTLTTSVSIGLATHMDKNNFDNLKEFMAAADEALYKAKAGGKNCLVVY